MIISGKSIKLKLIGYFISAFSIIIGLLILLLDYSNDKIFLILNFVGIGILSGLIGFFVLPNLYKIEWENNYLFISNNKNRIKVKLEDIRTIEESFNYINQAFKSSSIYNLILKKETEFGRVISFKSKSDLVFGQFKRLFKNQR